MKQTSLENEDFLGEINNQNILKKKSENEVNNTIKSVLDKIKKNVLLMIHKKEYDNALKVITKDLRIFYQEKRDYDRFNITPYTDDLIKKYNLNSYVNASEIIHEKITYFPCQFPKKRYSENFLNFLEKTGVSLIISLIPIEEDDYFTGIYLKNKIEHKDSKGNVIFYKEEYEINNKNYIRLRYLRWEDFDVPDKEEFGFFYNEYKGIRSLHKNIAVHCLAGVGRTGVTIMYDILCNMNYVDEGIFLDTLLMLRQSRPCLVYTAEQLKFLADIFIA
ncbi:Protein tyrosine phosphatase [Spraguea lophii 42_110]|uniref:Protein tyrosine phosphatase n=1 Tax=Spraguea lophii (strain 42_110) TaxID=1358809 RepID=S7XIZ4_SPRLO|nr:Protein tyrosine phosphatase [Spraguea lophii 42_110]